MCITGWMAEKRTWRSSPDATSPSQKQFFNESEMALFSERMPECARTHLTPPTSLSRWEKLGRGGTEDESVKLFIGVQQVKVLPGQS